ncbi:hypothetical protein N7G274_000895 [Stereocaulon virgatum]|uniref:Uncharacterized protein n=1 Tax=Stereocaulon virgatum TaxID=373712 RepID=A0ABR4AQ43_9LECA
MADDYDMLRFSSTGYVITLPITSEFHRHTSNLMFMPLSSHFCIGCSPALSSMPFVAIRHLPATDKRRAQGGFPRAVFHRRSGASIRFSIQLLEAALRVNSRFLLPSLAVASRSSPFIVVHFH